MAQINSGRPSYPTRLIFALPIAEHVHMRRLVVIDKNYNLEALRAKYRHHRIM
jgi:hypothetical protein